MGGAIACGMAKGSVIRPEDITVTARTPASLDRIRAVYPEITVFTDNRTAVGGADLIIIAVKPWQIESVVEEIRGCVEPGRTVIASVVAGVAFRQLSSMFYPVLAEEDAGGSGRQNAQERLPMYRIIPNTAVSIGCSTTFIASEAGPDCAGDAIGRQIDGGKTILHLVAEKKILHLCPQGGRRGRIPADSRGGLQEGLRLFKGWRAGNTHNRRHLLEASSGILFGRRARGQKRR